MPTAGELKEQQLRQWSASAPSWDRQHDRLERESRAVTDWLCKRAHLGPGMRVLDLACGSGHPALGEAQLVRPGGSVLATDFSAEMVEATRRRAQDAGLDNLDGRVVDAEAIDLPDGSFDAVTMRFGLMFCPQPERAAAEIRRVLRPGGRFALAVWDQPDKNPAQTVMTHALARFGGVAPSEEPVGPGFFALSGPGKLESVLKSAGFVSFDIESVAMVWEYSTLEEFWQVRALRYPPVATLVSQSNAVDMERFKTLLLEIVEPYASRGGGIQLTATALCAAGQKTS